MPPTNGSEETSNATTAPRESETVRGVQEKSTTERLTRLRELLRVAWESDDPRTYGRAMAAFFIQFREFDELMSNGAAMPEQWRI
jgi:hypothetical protein